MEPTGDNLRALLTKMTRLEDRVWARNPDEAGQGMRDEAMLTYLMTEDEHRQWCAVGAIVAQLRKLI